MVVGGGVKKNSLRKNKKIGGLGAVSCSAHQHLGQRQRRSKDAIIVLFCFVFLFSLSTLIREMSIYCCAILYFILYLYIFGFFHVFFFHSVSDARE